MSTPADKILAAALGAAGRKVAEAQALGRLQWRRGDTRLYGAQRDGDAVLTLVRRGSPVLTYEIVGVDLEALS